MKTTLTLETKTNKLSFKAALPKVSTIGELKFRTANRLCDLKNATKDILVKFTELGQNIPDKVNKYLINHNIVVNNGLILGSIFGAGSAVKLFYPDKNNEQIYGISIVKADKNKETYLFDGNKVLAQASNTRKYLSNKELESSGVEKNIEIISTAADSILLDLRRAFLPEIPSTKTVLSINNVEALQADKKSALTKKETSVSEMPIQEQVLPKIQEKTVKKPLPEGKIDTTEELDKILKHLMIKEPLNKLKTTPIMGLEGSVGNLLPVMQKSLSNSIDLFNKTNEIFKKRRYVVLSHLNSEMPDFETMNTKSITLKNIGKDNLKITFIPKVVYKDSPVGLSLLYVQNKDGEIIDTLPISKDGVLKMRSTYNPKVSTKPSAFISKKYLNQAEIDSKNLKFILTVLENRLSEIYELVSTGGGKIDEKLYERLKDAESKLGTFRQESLDSRIKLSEYSCSCHDLSLFKNINAKNQRLTWLPVNEGNSYRNTTIIKLQNEFGQYLEGMAIQDGKILKNHPKPYSEYIPKNPKFYSRSEIKELDLEKKLLNYIEILETQVDKNSSMLQKILKLRDMQKKGF